MSKRQRRTRAQMAKDAEERTDLVIRRVSEGATRDVIQRELVADYDMRPYKATEFVIATQRTMMNLDPQFAVEVLVGVRMGLANVMRSINDMYIDAIGRGDLQGQKDALVLKLRALSQLRDLAPRQMQVDAAIRDETEAKRLLFEVHGIDPETIIDVD